MAFDYSDFADLAAEMLAEYGQVGELERPTFTGPKHTPVMGEPEIYPATFVLTSFKSREIDGTRILQSDKRAIIAPGLAVAPMTSDWLVEANGDRFRLLDCMTIRPATTTIAYVAQVRR